MSEKKDGVLKELVERLERGELSSQELKKKLKRRGLAHHGLAETWSGVGTPVMLGLIYIPTIAKISGWNALSFFAQLSTIDFPLVLKCLVAIFIAFGLFLAVYAAIVLFPKGELKKVYFQGLTLKSMERTIVSLYFRRK